MPQNTFFQLMLVAVFCFIVTLLLLPDERKPPEGTVVLTMPGNNKAFVSPVTMPDGTKCVVVTANGAGRGISCNWKDQQQLKNPAVAMPDARLVDRLNQL